MVARGEDRNDEDENEKIENHNPKLATPPVESCAMLHPCAQRRRRGAAPVGGEGVLAAAVAMAAVYRRVHESTRLSSWLVALEAGGCEVKMFEDDLEDCG